MAGNHLFNLSDEQLQRRADTRSLKQLMMQEYVKERQHSRHSLQVESDPNKSWGTTPSITQHWYRRGCAHHSNQCTAVVTMTTAVSQALTHGQIYNLSQVGVIRPRNLLKHLLNGIACPIKYWSICRSTRGCGWVGFWSNRGHAPWGWAWPTAMWRSGSKRSIVCKKRMCEQCTPLLVSKPAPIVCTHHYYCTIVVARVKYRGCIPDYPTATW